MDLSYTWAHTRGFIKSMKLSGLLFLPSMHGHSICLPTHPNYCIHVSCSIHFFPLEKSRETAHTWRLHALSLLFFLNCVGFCCTIMWISHKYAYLPSIMSLPPTLPSHACRSSQSTELSSLCYTAASLQVSTLPMVVYICQCIEIYTYYLPAFCTRLKS